MKIDRVVIIMRLNLMHYPPMISLINILKDLGKEVVYIGGFTNDVVSEELEKRGVKMINLGYDLGGNISFISKLRKQLNYKKKIEEYLKEYDVSSNDLIWFIYTETASFLCNVLYNYNYVIQYYEYTESSLKWKYRILYPKYDCNEFIKKAVGIVQCEYNRAEIFRALNGLRKSPFVLPNKLYYRKGITTSIPFEISNQLEKIKKKIKGKKVVLYQGYFASEERKLEEFCEAINMMDNNYVMIAMGRGLDNYYDALKKRYESEKIIFVPFIIPPFHLNVTQMADIGVMTYSPHFRTYPSVINDLYCAPNKIFEYSKFGKPMIANSVPGLKIIFENYQCGAIIDYPITADKIKSVLLDIFENYSVYSKGSSNFYETIDVLKIVNNIIEDIEKTTN